jgi:sulfite reductase alpha subunit-like flavoprotein
VNKHQLELHTAFSRDQDSKVYVQDLIRIQAPALWRLIDEKRSKILLSGSSNKMPEQVAFAFKEIFMEQGGLDAIISFIETQHLSQSLRDALLPKKYNTL